MSDKVFRCSTDTAGGAYGLRIFIAAPEHNVPCEIREELDRLSTWGGSTSNLPEEESMWEFPLDAIAYAKAHVFLRTQGWQTKREAA